MWADLREGVTWSRKSFLSYVDLKILLNKGFLTNFKVVKKDILGPTYWRWKFSKCTDIHRNRKYLTSSAVKCTFVQSYPFSQILSHIHNYCVKYWWVSFACVVHGHLLWQLHCMFIFMNPFCGNHYWHVCHECPPYTWCVAIVLGSIATKASYTFFG